jgi:hypothetical protein
MTSLLTSAGAALIWPAPALDRDGLLRAFAALFVACGVAALPRRWRHAGTAILVVTLVFFALRSTPLPRPYSPRSKAGVFLYPHLPVQRRGAVIGARPLGEARMPQSIEMTRQQLVEDIMGDTKHPGIQEALKRAQASLDGYGQTATDKAKNANNLATQLAKSAPKPRDQRDSYQDTMNQYLLDLINDVAEMAAYTAGAANALKAAVDIMAKEMPSPRPPKPHSH